MDVKETSCRLCFKNITDESFEVVNNIVRNILNVLLKLKFDNESKEVICNVCRRKLNAALEFKSTCLNTDNKIIPYLDREKMLQLDLREVYMQEKKSDLVCSQKICRLCMHPVESEFRCIREVELEAIEKLAPEMNINIIKDPVVCKPCFDSLCTHNSFLKDCSEVEEKIKSIFDSSATGSQIDTSPLDVFIKTENPDRGFDINEMEMSIKAEFVDIKSEDEEKSDTPLQSSYIVPFEESDCKDEEEDGYENGSEVKTNETESEIHCARHENDLEAYKCKSCEYKTENKKLLQRHQLKHKDPSQVQMYKCNDCDYESKYKYAIKCHELKHKDPSQIQMYRCNHCNYESELKGNIKMHQLKHKESSQVQIYRCSDCDYESKYKNAVKRHLLKHKDPSLVEMYRCKDCDYETKYKYAIKRHLLKHTDQMYRCNDCSYETQLKDNIRKHQLKHKEPSQVQMYRCNDCDYETKLKGNFKEHQLQHKDPSQVQMYRCKDCDFETKYKNNIKKHQLKHKVPSLVEMYRCDNCDYETKYRYAIKKHQLKHKEQSQVEMYRCKECNFETKYKSNINKHQLKHKIPSLIKMYKCNDCDYETKFSDTPLQSPNIVPFEESNCKDEEEDGRKHENASEVKTKQQRKVLYKCDKRIYETESEIHFLQHSARPENDLEAYKSGSCEYETENEKLLQRNKDPSNVQVKDFDFETKYKDSNVQV
ncbi:zinc finger protein 99-like [Anoplophora glabripennis]|uniref:zinc finger protein 99-like n=1 Tax=Anoplophora glabripennis TaxID=217634 RepID=UPI0008738563|nr:zinc finger protein 99-like [Anoplophora glabripennis]